MWRAILKREILEYIKSTKFLIGLVVALGLVGLSTFINTADYVQRHQDFLDAHHTRLPLEGFGHRIAYRKPQILGILVQGKDRELGDQVMGQSDAVSTKPMGFMGYWSQNQRFMSGFAAIDFAFVVRVVMSLLVIFLAYDCVSQERVQGTLKLAMANSLSRGEFLWGKFLGGLVVLLGMLTVAVLVAALILVLHPDVRADGGVLASVGVLWALSALYLSVFFGLSVMLSTWLRSPATSLLVLLQIWIVLLVIWPHAGILLAQKVMAIPNSRELDERKHVLMSDFAQEYRAAHPEPADPNEKKDYERRMRRRRGELCRQVGFDYSRQLTRQVRLAHNLALLSPAVLYDRVAQRLARTDSEEYDRFVREAERFWVEHYWNEDNDRGRDEPPEFAYQGQSFGAVLEPTVSCWAILFLLGAACFAGAHTIFMKRDIG
jgi:ABC-2 type transport system permease protein